MGRRLDRINKIKASTSRYASLIRSGGGVVRWIKNEFEEMNNSSWKVMIINKELHLKSDTHRKYIPRNKDRRGITGSNACLLNQKNSLQCYVKNRMNLFCECWNYQYIIRSGNMIHLQAFKKQDEEGRVNNWRKQMRD